MGKEVNKIKNLILNPNKEHVGKILIGIEKNDGYCPCALIKSPDTKCNFSYFNLPKSTPITFLCNDGYNEKRCRCNLYVEDGGC